MLYLVVRTAVVRIPNGINDPPTTENMAMPSSSWDVLKWFLCCIIVTFAGLVFSFRITENLHSHKMSDRTVRKMRQLTFSSLGNAPDTRDTDDKQTIDHLTKQLMALDSEQNDTDDDRAARARELMNEVFGDYKLPEPDCSKKFLVYECSGKQVHCYGLGDRERGIVTAFLLALLTNRTLCVMHTKPCLLSSYFKPNLYNWTKCIPEYEKTTDTHLVTYMGKTGNLPDLSKVPSGDIWGNKAVILRTNGILFENISSNPHINETLPWVPLTNGRMIPHTLFHILFKLENSMQHQVDTLIDTMTQNGTRTLVGVHIRGEFFAINDTKYMLSFLERFSNKEKHVIYLATDEEEIKEQATAWFSNVHALNVTGLSLHVDKQSATCESLRLAILEQQILARSEILIKTRSAFSQQAYIIRGDKGAVYQYRGSMQNAPISFTKNTDFYNEQVAVY